MLTFYQYTHDRVLYMNSLRCVNSRFLTCIVWVVRKHDINSQNFTIDFVADRYNIIVIISLLLFVACPLAYAWGARKKTQKKKCKDKLWGIIGAN